MASLDPACNPGSTPQNLGATNCKSSTSDKFQTFRNIFGIFLSLSDQKIFTLFVLFLRGISCKRNHRTFQENKEKNRWFERNCPVLIVAWLYPTYAELDFLINNTFQSNHDEIQMFAHY